MDAVIKAIGNPLNALGTLLFSSLTLMQLKTNITSIKPSEVPTALAIEFKNVKELFNWTVPKTAQLVVIKGKYIPKDLYKPGENFLINKPQIWTSEAITKMKTIVSMNGIPAGTKIYW